MALDVLVMEHFIETVKRFPCLWKTTSTEYRDFEMKEAAWNEVVRETNLGSVKEVKNKWKKLRDSYRDALKRQSDMLAKDPNNTAKKYYPWKYMGLMQFLQPYMCNRLKKYDCANPTSETANAQNGGGNENNSSSDSESECETVKRKYSDQLNVIDQKLDYLCNAQNKRIFREEHYREIKRDIAMTPDPLDIFFNSMCQAIKRMPVENQISIKKTLFNAVIEAEEQLVAAQNCPPWANDGSSSSGHRDDDLDSKSFVAQSTVK